MYTKVCHRLQELNLFSKLFGIVLMMLSILFVENVYLVFTLIAISILISYILRNFEALQLSIILIVISLFYYAHPFLLIIVKLLMLYVFYLIIKNLTYNKEKMYLIDKLFYRLKNRSIINLYLNACYKTKCFSNNMKTFDDINKYTRRKYSSYIIKQAEIKTNYDLQDINYRHSLSYYKFYNKKTSMLNMKWGKLDSFVLLGTSLIMLLVLIYR
jgi:hypothetical protein